MRRSSPINAAISLSGTNSDTGAPPSFFTSHVNTFSAPINLSIATKGLPLRLSVANNAAPTNISLDSSFEGEFDLQTKLAPVSANGPLISYGMELFERITGQIGGPAPSSRTGSCGQVVAVSALGPISLNIVPWLVRASLYTSRLVASFYLIGVYYWYLNNVYIIFGRVQWGGCNGRLLSNFQTRSYRVNYTPLCNMSEESVTSPRPLDDGVIIHNLTKPDSRALKMKSLLLPLIT